MIAALLADAQHYSVGDVPHEYGGWILFIVIMWLMCRD